MPGKVSFRGVQFHPSREPPFKELTEKDIAILENAALKLTKKPFRTADFNLLIIEIFRAIELKHRCENTPTKKDRIANLRAILKIKDKNKFMHALLACDIDILKRIEQLDAELSCARFLRNGIFVDSDQAILRHTPHLELFTPYQYKNPKAPKFRINIEPYLPNGIEGIKECVSILLREELHDPSLAEREPNTTSFSGRPEKPYQLLVVQACVQFRKKHCPSCKRFDDAMYDFIEHIFEWIGPPRPGRSGITKLLKKIKIQPNKSSPLVSNASASILLLNHCCLSLHARRRQCVAKQILQEPSKS